MSFATNKGGAGKTTSTAAVAEVLAATGYKVLAVDFDSQGNLTKMLTQESIYKYTGRTAMEAIQQGDARPYRVHIKPGLDLLPAEDRLAAFSRHIYTSGIKHPYAALKRLLEPIEGEYDFVFVDVGPSLGDTSINAIVYADYIVIPIDTGDFAMDAAVRYVEFVEATRHEGHTRAEVLGLLLTKRAGRQTRYERDVSDGVREVFAGLAFDTEIHQRVRLKEMSATGIDINDPAMVDYIALAEEIISRIAERGK